MDQEKLESLLIDYIDGNLDPAQRELVEKELAQNEEARRMHAQLSEVIGLMARPEQFEMPESDQHAFEVALQQEILKKQAPDKGRVVFFTPTLYRAAAVVALVLSGVAVGYWLNTNSAQNQEIASLRKEMEATKHLMISMLGNEQSASQRMQGANVALTITKADDEIVKALAATLNHDPNTNVRLAALEALSQFIDEESVRKVLVASLSQQQDPVIQIALIQLLVKMKEKGVVNDLEKIIDDEKTIPAVKDEAYTGILQLS